MMRNINKNVLIHQLKDNLITLGNDHALRQPLYSKHEILVPSQKLRKVNTSSLITKNAVIKQEMVTSFYFSDIQKYSL